MAICDSARSSRDRQIQLVEADAFGRTEVGVPELEICGTAPQLDRSRERLLRRRMVTGETVTPTFVYQVREPSRVIAEASTASR